MNSQQLQVATLLNPDESQPRNSIPSTPTSSRLSQQLQQTNAPLPSINQGFEAGNSAGSAGRSNADYYALDSRRSSIDSRMQTGFSNMGLNNNNPASPYESQNASQISLAASLRRPNGQPPMSPLSGRNSMRAHHPPRIAPPIVPNARLPGAPDPTAAKPTQGFPWAFPDGPIPEEQQRRGSSSDDSSARNSVSRQNSFAASSIRSSIFSIDSTLPAGQRRFDDDAPTTHHHQLQHRSIASLQNDGTPSSATGNYSRTPELRVSHKLAERKRRSEMKDLFEDLNKAVPSNGGAKASKWEILTKCKSFRCRRFRATTDQSKAIDYIRNSQMQEGRMHQEMNRLRQEAEYARESHKEIDLLHAEINAMHERLRAQDPTGPHIYGQYTSRLAQQQTQQRVNGAPAAPYSLPPMNAASAQHQQQHPPPQHYSHMAPAGAMQGVEYGGPQRSSYEMR